MLRRVRVAGDSMWPTVRHGETLLVWTGAFRDREPRLGEVVVAWHPDGTRKVIKRVVSPPQGVSLRPGSVYLRGDNPGATTDSDHYGPVPSARLVGKAWFSTSRWRRIR